MLSKEYGSFEKVKEIFGGLDRSCILKRFSGRPGACQKAESPLCGLSCSDVSARELFTYQCRHTDEEVIDAAAELINLLLDGENYTFDFLMENLWWPGLTMTRAGDDEASALAGPLSKERHYAGYRASDAHESGTENAG